MTSRRRFAANGQVVRIFNPFTTRANPAGGFIRDQFADNKIPRELWDPVALNILKYYPLPNQPGDAVTGRNNYVATGTANLNTNNTDIRVDRNFGADGRGFARYSHRLRGDRAAAGVSRRPRDCRGARHRGEPRAQLRRGIQPDDRTDRRC